MDSLVSLCCFNIKQQLTRVIAIPKIHKNDRAAWQRWEIRRMAFDGKIQALSNRVDRLPEELRIKIDRMPQIRQYILMVSRCACSNRWGNYTTITIERSDYKKVHSARYEVNTILDLLPVPLDYGERFDISVWWSYDRKFNTGRLSRDTIEYGYFAVIHHDSTGVTLHEEIDDYTDC